MGFHDVCKNPLHKFDLNHDIECYFDENKNDYLLSGMCECGRWRIVYFKELKKWVKNNHYKVKKKLL